MIGAMTEPLRSGPAPAGRPPLVFVSYSRYDLDWRDRFDIALRPVIRTGGLELWSDARLVPGEIWRPELFAAIENSRAALLLVTARFLASQFIMEQELPALVAHGATLLPVLVEDCLWDEDPRLTDVQWLNDPGGGAIADDPNTTRSIMRTCRALRRLDLGNRGASAYGLGPVEVVDLEEDTAVPALKSAASPGLMHGVPVAPPALVERSEMAALRATIVGPGTGRLGITGGRALGLHGQGGIGKTVLAAALARDSEVLRHFPDGVLWVTLGERADLVAAQIGLLDRLGSPARDLRSTTDGLKRLRGALQNRSCLIVVDDVWSAAAAEAFAVAGPGSRVLYTTRYAAVLGNADVREIGVFEADSARELLAHIGGIKVSDLPADADRIRAATGCVPLALALAGAAVGRGARSWAEVADELEAAGQTFLDHPYANTFKALQVSLSGLSSELRAAYESLAVYPQDTRVPRSAIELWWAHNLRLEGERTRAYLLELHAARLLSFDHEAFAFHDLQRDFLLLHTDSARLLHHDLVGAYRDLIGSQTWGNLPQDEPYIWEHLVYHLCAAGDIGGATEAVADLGFIALRSFRSGPHAAEADIRHVAALTPGDAAVEWSGTVLAQWGHLLTGQDRLSDLAATLATRAVSAPETIDRGALDELLPRMWLEPRWGLPSAHPALTRILDRHKGSVSAVAFARDGTLATAGADRTVRLWNVTTGQLAATLIAHTRSVRAIAFAPDGLLASGGDDQTIRLWDVANGRQIGVLNGHTGSVRALAFAPDGKLVSAGVDGAVLVWDAASGIQTGTFEGHTDAVHAIAICEDGTIASAGDDRAVRLWDPNSERLSGVLQGHGPKRALAFSADGTLASPGADGAVRLWNASNVQQIVRLEGHSDAVLALAFAHDGTLASADADGTVRVWDASAGQQTSIVQAHIGSVRALAFSIDGTLASAGDDGTVRLWDLRATEPGNHVDGHRRSVRALAFASDGTLASAGDDRTVRIWDAVTGQQSQLLRGHRRSVRALAVAPDGMLASASGGKNGVVHLWGATSYQELRRLAGHTDWVLALAISPEGELASAGDDGTIRIWNRDTGEQTQLLAGHADSVRALAFAPDGALASGGADRTVRLWNLASGEQTRVLEGHARAVRALAFAPDGRVLASAGPDRTVRLWDPSTGQENRILRGHTGSIRALAFDPQGTTIASAGADRTVRIWDVVSGEPIVSVRVGGNVYALAWRQRELAAAIERSVACFTIVDGLRP